MNGELLKMDNVHSSFGDIDPLPDTLSPVEKFDYHLLPDGAFSDHVQDIVDRMQCPPDYVASALMVVLGSVIGKSYQIQPKQRDDWTVVPNLWGLVVGKPSQLKTPAVESILSHIKRLDAEAKDKYDSEIQAFECDKEFIKVERKDIDRKAAILLKKGETAEARELYASREDIVPPVRKCRFTNDSTIEKLGELLSQNGNGILGWRDEMSGFLRMIDSEQRPNDRAFYLEGFNGTGSYRCDRIGRGTIDIEHHVISLFGTIQPGRLASYVNHAIKQGSGDDGFSQRLQLAVYPDEPAHWVNIDKYPDHEAKNRVYEVIHTLAEMADAEEPVVLKFSPEAQSKFNEWRADLENNRLRNNDEHPALIAHLAKYRSLLPSLALILHLVDTCGGEIGDVSDVAIIKACGWCDYLESHARRIYSDAINNPVKSAKLILAKIESGKLPNGFTARDLRRKGWAGLTESPVLKEGLDSLVDYGYLLELTTETPGRPLVTYRINPKIEVQNHG